MLTTRTTATIVGVLFIVATGFFVFGQFIYGPILGAPNYLDLAYPARTRVMAGILVELTAVMAIPLISAFLFPVLRRHDEGVALAYVVVRVLEAIPLMFVDIGLLALLALSGGYLDGGATALEHWRTLGESIRAMGQPTFLVSVGLVFPVGALLLNGALWRARLVPRALSGWGFIGAALLLAGSIVQLLRAYGEPSPPGLEAVLWAPIAIQEMVFAGWLIVRGFEPMDL